MYRSLRPAIWIAKTGICTKKSPKGGKNNYKTGFFRLKRINVKTLEIIPPVNTQNENEELKQNERCDCIQSSQFAN